MLRLVLSNGSVVLIPILVWNVVFASKLPQAFKPDVFNRYVPTPIAFGEKTFRFAIFLMPLLMQLDISKPVGKVGAAVFVFGVLLYFLSWLSLVYAPASGWSASVFGFCAPACTPIIWLVGISLMANSYYFNVTYSCWHYIFPATLFSVFHVLHTAHVYARLGAG